MPVPELERLSSILREFNDLFGAIAWQDTDRVKEMITETIPFRVAQDAAFKNARQNSDQDNARIEHGKVLTRVMTALIKDDAELFKQFMDNDSFKRWMTETVFTLACLRCVRTARPENSPECCGVDVVLMSPVPASQILSDGPAFGCGAPR